MLQLHAADPVAVAAEDVAACAAVAAAAAAWSFAVFEPKRGYYYLDCPSLAS